MSSFEFSAKCAMIAVIDESMLRFTIGHFVEFDLNLSEGRWNMLTN